MPRRSQPRYDPSRNQWHLNYKRKKHFLCSGAGNYAQALARAGELMGPEPVRRRPVTVGDLITAWLGVAKPSRWTRDMLATWMDLYWDKIAAEEIDLDHLTRYHTALCELPGAQPRRKVPNGPKTRRGKLQIAMRVLKWGSRRGYCILPDWPDLDANPNHPKDYRPAELAAIFGQRKTARGKQRPRLSRFAVPIVRFILETGCRPSEACRLVWERDVELDANRCVLDRNKVLRTTGEPRTIPLTPAARALLEALPHRTGPVFVSRLRRPFTPRGLRSDIIRATGGRCRSVYSLRHTRAQSILENGGTLEDVAAVLGNTPAAAAIYARVRGRRGVAVAASLPALTPSTSLAPELHGTADGAAPEPQADQQQNRRRSGSRRRSA